MSRKRNIENSLIPKGRTLYFNEEAHKYTDDLNNEYISVNTLIGKYTNEFEKEKVAEACERIGKNPKHPKYLKYKGKTKKEILWEWEQETIKACNKGSIKHNYLEDCIKDSNGYNKNAKGFINGKIYTIDDIIKNHKYGKLNLKYFYDKGIHKKYPDIYAIVEHFTKQGYSIYAEIGVYNYKWLISGLIDILLVKDNNFVILDWKTNKAPIKFESGYFEKNIDGTLDLDRFVYQEKKMKYPLDHLDDSIGNHYVCQLNMYASMVEDFGFTCLGLILCHIRTIEGAKDDNGNEIEKVEVYDIPRIKDYINNLIQDHCKTRLKNSIHTLF